MSKEKTIRKHLKGRSCYGHLGGTLVERLFLRMLELGWFEPDEGKTTVYKVTPLGEKNWQSWAWIFVKRSNKW